MIYFHYRRSEENSAWWSDYQASTKLRRKLRTSQHFEDFDDNFDDLLGDLDNIGRTGDTTENASRKTKTESSSTSGYDTESPGASSCPSPEEEPGASKDFFLFTSKMVKVGLKFSLIDTTYEMLDCYTDKIFQEGVWESAMICGQSFASKVSNILSVLEKFKQALVSVHHG